MAGSEASASVLLSSDAFLSSAELSSSIIISSTLSSAGASGSVASVSEMLSIGSTLSGTVVVGVVSSLSAGKSFEGRVVTTGSVCTGSSGVSLFADVTLIEFILNSLLFLR